MEVTFVQLYPSSRCSLRLAEVDPHSAEALEQLECDLVIIEGEESFEPLLQGGQQGREKREEEQNTPVNRTPAEEKWPGEDPMKCTPS